jgi:hypothetical protein
VGVGADEVQLGHDIAAMRLDGFGGEIGLVRDLFRTESAANESKNVQFAIR